MALYFSLLLRGVPAELVHEVPARAPGGGRGDAQGHQVHIYIESTRILSTIICCYKHSRLQTKVLTRDKSSVAR